MAIWSEDENLNPAEYRKTGRTRRGRVIGTTLTDTLTIKASTRNVVKRMYTPININTVDGLVLDESKYEIKVRRTSPEEDEDDLFDESTLFVNFINEINTTDINFGGIATLWLRMKATEFITGQPNILTKVSRSQIYNKRKATFVDARNPGYILEDVYTNSNYGGGYSAERINEADIDELVAHCGTELVFNGIYDTLTNTYEAGQDAARIGKAAAVFRGNQVGSIIEKIKTPKFLVNASTKSLGQSSRQYRSVLDIATQVEVNFADESIKNTMNQVTIIDEQLYQSKIPPKKTTISPKGITTKEQAAIIGQRALASNKYNRRTGIFREDIRALDFTIGDVLAYQDNVSRWGNGTRVLDVVGNQITLAEEITMVAGKTYQIVFQNDLDELFYKTLIGDETTNTVIVDDSTGIIKGSYYIFTNVEDIFLVKATDKEVTQDKKVKVAWEEYNESLLNNDFSDDALNQINPPDQPINRISNIVITEGLIIDKDGAIITELNFSWENTVDSYVSIYATPVGVDDNSENRISLITNTYLTNINITSKRLIDGETYVFYFRDRNNRQEITYTILGKTAPPPDVDIFTISGRPTEVKTLVYDIIDKPLDFQGYIIKYQIGQTLNWNTAQKIHEGILLSSPYKADITRVAGQYNLLIKGVDRSGNESTNVKAIQFNQNESLIDNLIYEKDFHALAFPGIIEGGTVQGNNDLLADASLDLFYFRQDSEQFYPLNDSEQFYQGTFEPMTFIGEFIPDGGGTALIEYDGEATPKFEYREVGATPMYFNDSFLMYPKLDTELFYTDDLWLPYSGGFEVKADIRYEIRVSYIEGNVQPRISKLKVIIDVEDIDESFDDIIVLDTGTTVTTKYITRLKNVVATLQTSLGSTAIKVEAEKISETEVTLRCYDISDTQVSGLVDLRLKGYINE